MSSTNKDISYKNDFEKFLSYTDEKAVLFREISKIISDRNVKSVFDIGAGNGQLSIPLSSTVETYKAIEKKHSFVEKLQAGGIDTVEGEFPLEIDGLYDLVLVSHALSYEKGQIISFISSAWNLVSQNGMLLLITYRDDDNDWNRFMKFLGKEPGSRNEEGYQELMGYLNSVGTISTRKVITTVKTENIDELVDALSFVASNGIPELKNEFVAQSDKIKTFLESYQSSEGYVFPFQHFFITTTKA